MISNQGFPKRMDYVTSTGNSFRRYLKLETLAGNKFDATGYLFDFVTMEGSQIKYPYSKIGITPIETDEVIYIPIELQSNPQARGDFKNVLAARKNGQKYSWLAGKFIISGRADYDELQQDIIIINTPTLQVMITVLLIAPEEETAPQASIGSIIIGSTFTIA